MALDVPENKEKTRGNSSEDATAVNHARRLGLIPAHDQSAAARAVGKDSACDQQQLSSQPLVSKSGNRQFSAPLSLEENGTKSSVNHEMKTTPTRRLLGSGTSRMSDFATEHIVAVRYAASVSIAMLVAYGIAHTPLFFRYRTVAELPSKFFVRRRKLACRIIKADKDSSNRQIILWLRHLSLLERFCVSNSWFERVVSMHPSSMVKRSVDQEPSQLLKVALAGAQYPPYFWEDGWLGQLVEDKAPVTCQCLARSALSAPLSNVAGSSSPWAGAGTNSVLQSGFYERKKRPIPELEQNTLTGILSADQVAICKITFRPRASSSLWLVRMFQSSDLALSMVASGRAIANDDSLYAATSLVDYTLIDKSEAVEDLRRDATYLDQLSRLEYQAARGFRGIWSDTSYRESRPDVVEEAEFQASATVLQKVWRWIRGG